MSSGKQTMSFKADPDMKEEVDRYQERRGLEDRSDALRELVTVGVREQRNPIVWRFKDRVIEWINLLTVSGVIVFVLGAATDVLSFQQGVAASVVMLILATMFMSAFELTRTTLGMNEIGAKVRDVLGRERYD